MNRFAALLRASASLVFIVALSSCGGMRAAEHPSAPPNPPPVAEVPPAAPPASAAAEPNKDLPLDTSSVPPCSCAEVDAKTKPKSKPKPKPIHKEAPPQLPTAPVVTETAPGGLVNAQVKPMSVSVMSILGKRVQDTKGDDIGRVVDVLADSSGRVRIAIIDFGGFLGVGDRRIAVDWPLLRFNPDGRDPSVRLSVSREKLKTAPEYRDNPRPQTLMEPPAPAPAPTPPPAEGNK